MKALILTLDEELASLRLPKYYDSPRLHTSIAWSSATSDTSTDSSLAFDDATIISLNEDLGDKLRLDALWVGSLCLKIGKQVTRYALQSTSFTSAIS